jgi:hypothetical protein
MIMDGSPCCSAYSVECSISAEHYISSFIIPRFTRSDVVSVRCNAVDALEHAVQNTRLSYHSQ